MAKLFKKKGITDTLVNVGVGGAANVAMDYAWGALSDTLGSIAEYKNYIKIAVGALGGSMTKGKIAHAAFDGIAVVGASELISGLIAGTDAAATQTTTGLPYGTIGRVRPGMQGYAKKKSNGFTVAGTTIFK